jgi:hypothetical protein
MDSKFKLIGHTAQTTAKVYFQFATVLFIGKTITERNVKPERNLKFLKCALFSFVFLCL